jgi:hypothetical protein
MTRWRWVAVVALACLVVGGVIAVAIAGGGANPPAPTDQASSKSKVPTDTGGQPASDNKSPAHHGGPPFPPLKGAVEPATMLTGYDCGFVPPTVFYPVNNGWRVGDPRGTTIVCAGGGGQGGHSTGRFLILRTDEIHVKQHLSKVDVPGAGPLTITRAPLGRHVVRSAQRNGTLDFKGSHGVTGTLHLKDDTVSLNP